MAKYAGSRTKPVFCFSDVVLFFGGAFMSLILVWSFFSFSSSISPNLNVKTDDSTTCTRGIDMRYDPTDPVYFDDPDLTYTIDKPVKGWDEKRRRWLELHPSFIPGAENRTVMVTGSQSTPCKNPIGDHLLLRFFKNKVDYCRIHGHDIFYSNALLHPKMNSYWAKLPAVKAAMIAHPEAEWIWWVDSDALFTDMDFTPPWHRYRNHNLVVHGWPGVIYDDRSWTALNAGVFLIRNCQWSMELIDTWTDDQTALIYLMYKHRDVYYPKVYLEGEYYFEGYWLEVVPGLANVTERYLEMEREDATLRRRHAEKVSERYGAFREERFLRGERGGKGSKRRPFVTHFTGCQPCSGDHNKMYDGDTCWNWMIKAINFADNQVMRKFGFVHSDLGKTSPLQPVPFDYPDEPW
ncbi:putative glycosyltransferase 7 [Cardamine amara subsp. amara]|uniref:Glycosyltransferase 7 n=1 Tax=Cardamine amara subsp. amara TaxID=228776 RepID=A0ABD0Z3S8_CARAN